MADDHSCIIVVTDANKSAVSKVLASFWGDDPPGTDEFSVGFSTDGNAPATHWGLHIWQSAANAAILAAMPTPANVGTLPSPMLSNLSDYSITSQTALTACAAISRVSVMTGPGLVPNDHLDLVLDGLGLQRI